MNNGGDAPRSGQRTPPEPPGRQTPMADTPTPSTEGAALQRVAKLEQQVDTLAKAVNEASVIVASLAARQQAATTTPPAPRGTDTEPELVAWVQWYVRRYQIDDIPQCWAEHGALVEELDALRLGWHDTIGAGAPGLLATQWHDYAGRALDRIRTRWRTCPDGHRPPAPADWTDTNPADATQPDLHDRPSAD